MALSSKISFLLFLLTLLSSYHHIHARDSQFFNKIPSNNNVANEIQPNQEEDPLDKFEQEPNFIPENNQNGAYGLYGHESGQLPPSTTTKTNLPYKNEVVEPNEVLPKYLPKNYNTQAYVTEPEGYHPSQETNTNNYYQTQKQGYPATTTAATNYYQNYGGNNNYNGQQQQQGVNEYNLGQKSYTTSGGDSNYNNAAAGEKQKQKQGMSDTRFLENGKYFYDLNLEKNTNRYPFDNTRRFGDQYSKYGNNNENSNEFNNYSNSNDGFESKGEQFQDFQEDNEEALP